MDFGVWWKMGSVGGRDATCNWDSFGCRDWIEGCLGDRLLAGWNGWVQGDGIVVIGWLNGLMMKSRKEFQKKDYI